MADQDHTATNARGARRPSLARAKGLRLGFAILRLGLMLSAAFAIVRLASAEIDFNIDLNGDTIPSVREAAKIGNSEYWMHLAELDPSQAQHLLKEAALADPRNASVWIALGLVEERLVEERVAGEDAAENRRSPNHRSTKHITTTRDFTTARAAFDKAFALDRQYGPAWALANFCLRHNDQGPEYDACFWRAAARAALRSPSLADLAIADSGGHEAGASANLTDLAPLLDLAGRMEPSAAKTLDRLSASIDQFAAADRATATYARSLGRELERAWLNDLIGQERWEDAALIARRVESRHDTGDKARLDDLVDRLIAAGKAPEAVATWNGYATSGSAPSTSATPGATAFTPLAPFKGASLTNGDFASEPTDIGFDWQLGLHPGGAFGSALSIDARQIAKKWQPHMLEFRLSGGEPEQVPMSEQWLPLARGTYRLRFEYSTRGLAAPTGIRWDLAMRTDSQTRENQAEEKERHAEDAALAPSEQWRAGEWTFSNMFLNDGAMPLALGRLRLIYSREPGTERARGIFSLRRVRLETL